MMVDRLGREEEPLGDLPVAQPLLDQRQHLDLARRQVRRVVARRCAAGRGGSPRAPRARRRRATIAAAGAAPSSWSWSSARRRASASPSASASAASYGRPIAAHRAAARLPVAGELQGVGLGDVGGDLVGDPRAPAPQRQLAERPTRRRASLRQLEGGLGRVARRRRDRRAARRPRRARRRRPRCTAARSEHLRQRQRRRRATSAEPGSPRRARTSPSVTPARMRGIDEERASPRTTDAVSAASVHRPWSSCERDWKPCRYSRHRSRRGSAQCAQAGGQRRVGRPRSRGCAAPSRRGGCSPARRPRPARPPARARCCARASRGRRSRRPRSSIVPMVLSACRRISTSSRRSASSSARAPHATVPSASSRFMHRVAMFA